MASLSIKKEVERLKKKIGLNDEPKEIFVLKNRFNPNDIQYAFPKDSELDKINQLFDIQKYINSDRKDKLIRDMISDIDDKFFSYDDRVNNNLKYIQEDNTEDNYDFGNIQVLNPFSPITYIRKVILKNTTVDNEKIKENKSKFILLLSNIINLFVDRNGDEIQLEIKDLEEFELDILFKTQINYYFKNYNSIIEKDDDAHKDYNKDFLNIFNFVNESNEYLLKCYANIFVFPPVEVGKSFLYEIFYNFIKGLLDCGKYNRADPATPVLINPLLQQIERLCNDFTNRLPDPLPPNTTKIDDLNKIINSKIQNNKFNLNNFPIDINDLLELPQKPKLTFFKTSSTQQNIEFKKNNIQVTIRSFLDLYEQNLEKVDDKKLNIQILYRDNDGEDYYPYSLEKIII